MPRGDEEMARIDHKPFMAALNKYVEQRCSQLGISPPELGNTKWLTLAAKKTRVSRATLQKMARGQAVSATSIEEVLESLGLSALEVVLPEHDLPIPDDPETFMRFRHGYFLADLRSDGGRPYARWCTETFSLSAEVEERPTGKILWARGTFVNQQGLTFSVEMKLLNPYLLTMEAVQQGVKSADARILFRGMFTATFNLCHLLPGEDNRVLCGFWHGVTAYGTPAAYRFFIATRELRPEELAGLAERFKYKSILHAEEVLPP
jgi:hypothetical protein